MEGRAAKAVIVAGDAGQGVAVEAVDGDLVVVVGATGRITKIEAGAGQDRVAGTEHRVPHTRRATVGRPLEGRLHVRFG